MAVKDLRMRKRDVFKLSGIAAVLASLCCITPIVIVLLGLSSVSAAAALSDTLYYGYRWVFITIALVFLALALTVYFRNRGICTLDKAKRYWNQIVNTTIIVLVVSVLTYVVFNYVVLEFIGVWLGIWQLPF